MELSFSVSRRSRVEKEKEADEIALGKGYGRELMQERLYQLSIDNKKRLEKEKKVYLSPEALKDLVELY